MQAVVHGLAQQDMVGHLQRAGDVLLAADLLREDGGEQVVGDHALEERLHALAAALPRHGEGARRVPAPARREERDVEARLTHGLLGVVRGDVVVRLLQREAVLRAEGEQDAVVVGGGLQLEVEAHAEALAQREAPRAVDPRPERRVHHQLHPARLVEEALEHHVAVGRDDAEPVTRRAHVVDDLLRAAEVEAGLADELLLEPLAVRQALLDVTAEAADLLAQLDGAARRLAEPEGNRGRRAAGVLDAHDPLLNAPDAPRGGAEKEDVAGHALDGPVLVHGSDDSLVGLRDDAVVAQLGDRAAVLDGHRPRVAARAQHAIDAVAVQQRASAPGAFAHPLRKHVDDLAEVVAAQVPVRRGAPEQRVQVVLGPLLARRLRHDLLRQHVERRDGLHDAVEASPADGPHQRSALDQLVARGGEDAPLRAHAERVSGAADALQERRDATRRPHLAHEVDRADVDAELERGGGDERAQFAVLEPLLQPQPALLGEAAVVARDVLLAEPLRELMRHALRHPPRVHEHEGGAMSGDQLGDAVVDLAPLLRRRDRTQLAPGYLDREVDVALMAEVDDGAVRFALGVDTVATDEERGDLLDRPLRRRQPDAGGPIPAVRGDDVVEARGGQREVAAAPVTRERVDLVDDERADVVQRRAAALGGDHQVQRLGRGDEDMRRAADDRLPLGLRRVAAAHGSADDGQVVAHLDGDLPDLLERLLEVAVDVVAERLQRRDVDDLRHVLERPRLRLAHEVVDAGEEGREGLAGAGGGADERVAAAADVPPAGALGVGGRVEVPSEPRVDDGVELDARCDRRLRQRHPVTSTNMRAGRAFAAYAPEPRNSTCDGPLLRRAPVCA